MLPLPVAATEPPPGATHVFAMSLATGHNNQLFTLFIVEQEDGRIIKRSTITREQFVDQARGRTQSPANPLGEDLFTKHDVKACMPELTEDGRRLLNDCPVLDDLWKLRFWEYPYLLRNGQRMGKGWAENERSPSERQLLLLSDYGVQHPMDLFLGDQFFRLLHDMGDEEWVDNYRKGY